MNELEELMAGLFGSLNAPAAEDPRLRDESQGFAGGSVAGPNIMFQRLLPLLMGAPGVVRFPERGLGPQGPGLNGLAGLLAGGSGLNPIGGPNVAPGNIDNGRSNNQPNPQLAGPGEGSLGQEPGVQGGAAPPRGGAVQPRRATTLPGYLARFGGGR
jgi:hypothetical protein